MNKIIVDRADDLYSIIQDIKSSDSPEIVISLSRDVPFLGNNISLKLLESEAKKFNKNLTFEGRDKVASAIIKHYYSQNIQTAKAPIEEPRKEDEESFPTPTFKVPMLKNYKNIFFTILALAGILLSIWGILWYLPKASVKIDMNSEMLVKNVEITVSSKTDKMDVDKKTIPGIFIESTKKGTDSIKTTGTKEVGEKAKGTVKIFNKTSKEKTFDKGTEITLISTEKENLTFLLLEDAKVPAKSVKVGDTGETVTYGTAEVNVEAKDFGKEYNIPQDEKFKIDDLDTTEYLAQNEKPFEGGSKKTVAAVSEEDKKNLEKKLEESLTSIARADLESKLVGDQKLAEGAVSTESSNITFDKEIGDEADTLNLTMQVKAYAIVYSQKDLENLVKIILKKAVPKEFDISDSEERIEVANVIAKNTEGADKTSLTLQVKTRSYVVPKIDINEIKMNLLGKKIPEAENYLNSLKNVTSFELVVWPQLPKPIRTTPHLPSRIDIKISHK